MLHEYEPSVINVICTV